MPTRSVEEHVASLTVKMLRARLKKEGRSTKGLKDQLADRLLATLRAKEPATALRRPDEGEQAGYGLRDGPQRRRRLMGWEGGYFLRSEIKKEGRELLD